ncbi:hypothetical protein QPK13_22755 [Photorhabdus tasmaniensis]
MTDNNEGVLSAATSCLLYVRENGNRVAGELSVTMTNNLIQRWLLSAERRNLHSRSSLRSIRTILKHARKNKEPDLKSVIRLLVEGNGELPDVSASDLGNVENIRNALIRLGWWVKFGASHEWQHINLQRQPVCFGLRSDLNRCFRHDGQQSDLLPLYVTGKPEELREILGKFSYRLHIESSEVVETITVWRCFIETGVMNGQ